MAKDNTQFAAWMKIQNDVTRVTTIRLSLPLLAAIDKWRNQWRGKQKPTRTDVIRYALEQHFLTGGKND